MGRRAGVQTPSRVPSQQNLQWTEHTIYFFHQNIMHCIREIHHSRATNLQLHILQNKV